MAYLRVRGEGGTLFPKDRCVVSFDGTHIAYTIKGNDGPLVALCAGLCCPDNFWRYLAPALAKRYRVLIWNYRGCGVSGMPREPGYRARNYAVEDFTCDRYARDLKAIMDHEGIAEAVVLGHSMGTQVGLEAYRIMPERITALVSITGPYASAVNSLYNTTIAPRLFPLGMLAARAVFRPAWRGLFRLPIVYPLAVQFGALGPKTKHEDMKPYYEHLAELDPQVILLMAQAMHVHSAEDMLRKVKVPTLVIVGERDNFVPPWLGHVMASRIPVAELLVVPGGTHGTIVEEPKLVNRTVLDFLDRHLGEGQQTVSLVDRRARTARKRAPRRSGPQKGVEA
ncbi:MAG: alpha/beta fold hydrolase [Actinomycetota bacterium]